jgi:hypothetical protein
MHVIALFLAAAAATAPTAAPLPDGFSALSPAPAGDMAGRLCSDDRRWCVVPPEAEDGTLYVDVGTKGESYWSLPEGDGSAYRLVPAIAPLKAGSALLLMEASRSVGYSGGGGDFKTWVVLHVAPDGAITPALRAPISGSLMIRACFSDKDMEQRLDACHDEYEMTGTIALRDNGAAMPSIRYVTGARFFPRTIRRGVDSLSLPPLKKEDLVWAADPACSYDRTFTWDQANGQYASSAPLPDCSEYLKD